MYFSIKSQQITVLEDDSIISKKRIKSLEENTSKMFSDVEHHNIVIEVYMF